MNEKIESLKGKLIVSCRALPHEPLHSASIMDRTTLVAKGSGAYDIRADIKEDIVETQTQVDLSAIGVVKYDYGDSKVYITSTMKEISELMEAKPEIIAPDATGDLRPGSRTLDEFYKETRKSYSGQLLVTNCSTVEEALHTDQLGFDLIGTTLVGYTDQNRDLKIEPNDFEIIRQIVATMKHRVITEGNINTPEKAKRVIELGAFSMVAGFVVTKPQLTAKSFTQTLDQYKYVNRLMVKGTGQIIKRRSKTIADLEKYKGVTSVFHACYDAEGNVSPERVRALTEYHIRKGVKGVYVNGSPGEYIYQSLEDRKTTLGNVMAAAKDRLTVIAHVGCNNTRDGVELAKHAESLNVGAIASIPPICFHLPEYVIVVHQDAVSQVTPNTGFIIYNIPQLVGAALTQSLSAEMKKDPRIIGVENFSMPVQDIQMLRLVGGDDYIIFNGPDEQFISGRVIGAEAGIGGTYGVVPELFLKMDELMRVGKMEEAIRIQYTASDIIYKMCSGYGNMCGMIKEILRTNKSLDLGGTRELLPQLVKPDFAIAQEAARMVREAVVAYC